jgi:hypothetical protein
MKQSKKMSFFKRHKSLATIIFILVGVSVILTTIYIYNSVSISSFQSGLSNFYNTQDLPTEGPLGEVIRSEPLNTTLSNGLAKRIVYRTQKADGTNTFSSGMIFIPNTPATSPRPIVAWAHGTLGMGDECAPSRQQDPVIDTGMTWVDSMLERGWVVVSTDYAGFGTPGIEGYLVGNSEANDVLNSVRAAKNVPGSDVGNTYAIWGHSQGGHSALFSSNNTQIYLPEFKLLGTVASAPAAQLQSLFNQQASTAAAWIIGPEVMMSWPNNYPELNVDSILSKPGINNYEPIAKKCVKAAAIEGIVRDKLGQKFFNDNFLTDPQWSNVISQQTAPVLKPNQPLLVAESLTDDVVLPNTTAQYIQRACNANSNIASLWLTNVGHIQLQTVISPDVINWIGDRFAGKVNVSNCNQPLPIAPAQ